MQTLSYAERIPYCPNPTAKKLLSLIEQKQTNLAVSADAFRSTELLNLADKTGSEICMLKTHIDLLEDFTPAVIQALTDLATKHQFLIFEDRKFADIGNTVKGQYGKGMYCIADWAHITNAHTLPGEGIINGLKEVGLPRGNALLLIAEMSSSGHLMNADYQQSTLKMALAHKDFVCGFITQHRLTDDPAFIHCTPGVSLTAGGDMLGQQYISPETAILEHHSDVIIVGRGIYQANDPKAEAAKYRELGWRAYQKRQKSI
ncbi:MAG TPA: orotidine-5'-phosphate decarboxylase [Gammaproteobacteria bacterium]|nr:orotidine-5'-phosphate decarboxylase [Gammaproteobacteria bacterium]